jgi:hypothetical protein
MNWITVCSNTNVLEDMNRSQKSDYGTERQGSVVSSPDYQNRVDFCRAKIRELQYFDPSIKSSLENLQGEVISVESLDLVSVCKEFRYMYLKNIIEAKSFVKAKNPDVSNFVKFLSLQQI